MRRTAVSIVGVLVFSLVACDNADPRVSAEVVRRTPGEVCIDVEDPTFDDLSGCFPYRSADADALAEGRCVSLRVREPADDRGVYGVKVLDRTCHDGRKPSTFTLRKVLGFVLYGLLLTIIVAGFAIVLRRRTTSRSR